MAISFLERPRLFDALDRDRQRAVWICAPAGSGKSVLLRTYLSARGLPTVWLDLDAAQRDSAVIGASLQSAVAQAAAGVAVPVAGRRGTRKAATGTPSTVAWVVDDAQGLDDEVLCSAVCSVLVERQPPVALLLASRLPPSSRWAVALAHSQLVVLDGNSLRFDIDEARALAQLCGADAAQAERWQQQTSGWAAGLTLCMQLERGSAAPAARRQTAEALRRLLAESVASELGAAARPAVAILAQADEVPATLLDGDAPWSDAVAYLARLAGSGLFVDTLDSGALRLHPPLREALIAGVSDPATVAKASEALIAAGRPDLALRLCARLAAAEVEPLLARLGERLLGRADAGAVAGAVLADTDAVQSLSAAGLLWCARALLADDAERADAIAERAYAACTVGNDDGLRRRSAAVGLVAQSIVLNGERMAWWAERFAARVLDADGVVEAAAVLVVAFGSIGATVDSANRGAARERLRARLTAGAVAHENLLAASVLLIAYQREGDSRAIEGLCFDVEGNAWFERAPPRARIDWNLSKGIVCAGLGSVEAARLSFDAALEASLAVGAAAPANAAREGLARLALNTGDLDAAAIHIQSLQATLGQRQPRQQCIVLSLLAGYELARSRHARALAALDAGVELLKAKSLQPSALLERDRVQVLWDMERRADAFAQARATSAPKGMLADIAAANGALLEFLSCGEPDAPAATEALRRGLELAARHRWTNFLSLLPRQAGEVAAAGLSRKLEPALLTEAVRVRRLPAPEAADDAWPWALRVRLFGGLQLERDGLPVLFKGKVQRKPLEVLKYLGCAPSLAADMDAIAAALWSDADAGNGRRSLESAIWRLRESLGEPSWIVVRDSRVQLATEQVWVDTQRFWRVARAIEPAAYGERVEESRALAERLLDLYPGELLPADPESPWLIAARERARSTFLRAARVLADRLERHDRAAAIAVLERALALEPLAEDCAQRLMLLYRDGGDVVAALRVYRQLSRMPSVLVGVRPGRQTEAIRETLH